MVFSGVRAPLFSPSRIIHSAGRSLTEPPGLYHSALPRILTPGTSPEMLGSSRSGVLPTSSVPSSPARLLIRVIMSGLLYRVNFSRPGKEGYLLTQQPEGPEREPPGHGWCVTGDYTRASRSGATAKCQLS